MNNSYITYVFQFIFLVLLQVLILDQILFLGYVNPYVYILFIIALPLGFKRINILFLGFFLGLCVDVFNDTGGVHAASTLLIAFLRPLALRLSFGFNFIDNSVSLKTADFKEKIIYVFLMVFIHHILMFSLEYFSVNYAIGILKNILYSGVFSSILILIILNYWHKKKA